MTAMMSGRQPLHLVIGSSHYRAPSPSSEATSSNDSPSETDHALFSVLCCFDFESDDPAHLPFHKNEILDIVQQENTGWWAAMRRGGTSLGWIPMAFVRELSEEMTERLLKVVEELRVYEYEAELLYNEPVTRLNDSLYEEPTPSPALYARRYSQQTPSPSLPQNGNVSELFHLQNMSNRASRLGPSVLYPMQDLRNPPPRVETLSLRRHHRRTFPHRPSLLCHFLLHIMDIHSTSPLLPHPEKPKILVWRRRHLPQ